MMFIGGRNDNGDYMNPAPCNWSLIAVMLDRVFSLYSITDIPLLTVAMYSQIVNLVQILYLTHYSTFP